MRRYSAPCFASAAPPLSAVPGNSTYELSRTRAYEGWQFGIYGAGEVVDPQRAFPRALLLGSLTLTGLYLIAIVAYLNALGPAASTNSEAIAATAATAVLGPWAGRAIAFPILTSGGVPLWEPPPTLRCPTDCRKPRP